MKKILLIVGLFMLALSASGQRLNYVNSYGMQFKRLGADSLSFMPADTFSVPAAYVGKRFTAVKGGVLYYWNGSAWTAATGSVPTLQQVVTAGNTSDKAIEFMSENSYNNGLRYNGNNRWAYRDTSRPAFMFGSTDFDSPTILQGFYNEIELNDGSIYYRAAGAHQFDDTVYLQAAPGSATDSLLTWNATTRRVNKLPMYQERIQNIDLSSDDDTITAPGIIMIDNGSNGPGFKELLFPNPANYQGKTITVINYDTVFDALYNATNAPVNPSGSAFTKAVKGYSYIFKSDGIKWYCVSRYTGTTD